MNINIHCIRYHFLNIFTGVIQSSLISVSNQKGALRSTSFVFHDRFGAANQNSVRAGGARLFPRRKTTSFGQCLRCFLIALLVSALITRGAVLRRLPKSCYTVPSFSKGTRPRNLSPPRFHQGVQRLECLRFCLLRECSVIEVVQAHVLPYRVRCF